MSTALAKTVTLVGVYTLDGGFVLVDARGSSYAVQTPDELWAKLGHVVNDQELPKCVLAPTPEEGLENVCSQVQDFVGDEYGSTAGKVAGEAVRVTGRFLRKISRANR